MTRKTRYIGSMIALFTAWIANGVTGHDEAFKVIAVAMMFVSYVFWAPEETKKKPLVKGTIQFDKRNYDVPAMRFVFDGDPIKIINYDEVIFKVDRNADLSELDESKYLPPL